MRSLYAVYRADTQSREWESVRLSVIDERPMAPATTLNALAYSISLGRQTSHSPPLSTSCENPFGGIPISILLGDFLQLPPVESSGLADDPAGCEGAESVEAHGG